MGLAKSDGIIANPDIKATKQPRLFSMPKVSVLISNYNYASYLEDCVKSVYTQTYDSIELIIVDDLSTDRSPEVLSRLEAEYEELIVIRRKVNGGQSAAALDGLARCTGDYVVFLDADDMLMPVAIESHVFTHISLRFPVGFTCADMLQLSGEALIGGSSIPLNRFVTKQKAKFLARRATTEAVALQKTLSTELLENIYLVDPWDDSSWVWSATSAMMFRRDALRLWEDTPDLNQLRYSTDAFFCYGINVITGSAIIDMPLACYRIHGKNGFASSLPLNHVRSFTQNSAGERSLQAVHLLLKEAVRNKEEYQRLFWTTESYDEMIRRLKKLAAVIDPKIGFLKKIANIIKR